MVRGAKKQGRPFDADLPGGMSHAEIGERMNLTPQRVGQIEREAFRKMREEAIRLGLSLEGLFQ
ncbi:MAG: Sigma-70, region 4 [Myxococcaceae bacterium]|nr:Sigma-70, region 4 [Myxococcaceae bacterium]